MPNTNVLTGADGSITLSVPPGAEGEAADAVISEFDTISVGRVTDVRVEVEADVKAFHEIGQRYASELRTGNVHIRGTIGRAYLNGALIKLLLGEAATSRPAASWVQPALNITVRLGNAAQEGVSSSLTLHDVKLERWSFQLPEDDFVMESVGFRALYMTSGDEG